jgi:hypothetical protein
VLKLLKMVTWTVSSTLMRMDATGMKAHVLELLEVVIWTVSSTLMRTDVNGMKTHVLEVQLIMNI